MRQIHPSTNARETRRQTRRHAGAAAILGCVALLASRSAAAADPASSWFPLEQGNAWTLEDASGAKTIAIQCPQAQASYFMLTGFPLGYTAGQWLVPSSAGTELELWNGWAQSFSDLVRVGTNAGAPWTLDLAEPGQCVVQAQWTQTDVSVVTSAGTFAHGRTLGLTVVSPQGSSPYAAVDVSSLTFAPGVGPVECVGTDGLTYRLVTAKVGATLYPLPVAPPAPAPPPIPAPPPSLGIQGNAGAPSLLLTLAASDGTTRTTFSAADGTYSFVVTNPGTYTVTPIETQGVAVQPAFQSVTVGGSTTVATASFWATSAAPYSGTLVGKVQALHRQTGYFVLGTSQGAFTVLNFPKSFGGEVDGSDGYLVTVLGTIDPVAKTVQFTGFAAQVTRGFTVETPTTKQTFTVGEAVTIVGPDGSQDYWTSDGWQIPVADVSYGTRAP